MRSDFLTGGGGLGRNIDPMYTNGKCLHRRQLHIVARRDFFHINIKLLCAFAQLHKPCHYLQDIIEKTDTSASPHQGQCYDFLIFSPTNGNLLCRIALI
jgi:hypothetical protein